ncbi:hypothetical protein B0H17DRAFT_1212461 [Mycena rosella]|uniref:Uncharacterized protein n=1 Tax=Mycena rosella TaxID=1033263 RepID=A0AAD7G6H7_MYCRO|nr:hypothetical protein B0H17DRAFT_1212461 [Mycena rosella]
MSRLAKCVPLLLAALLLVPVSCLLRNASRITTLGGALTYSFGLSILQLAASWPPSALLPVPPGRRLCLVRGLLRGAEEQPSHAPPRLLPRLHGLHHQFITVLAAGGLACEELDRQPELAQRLGDALPDETRERAAFALLVHFLLAISTHYAPLIATTACEDQHIHLLPPPSNVPADVVYAPARALGRPHRRGVGPRARARCGHGRRAQHTGVYDVRVRSGSSLVPGPRPLPRPPRSTLPRGSELNTPLYIPVLIPCCTCTHP